ncbi:MAG TPA: hypothetical protein VIJ46_01580, partial [Rhabdochlamydiaceae bacterium]
TGSVLSPPAAAASNAPGNGLIKAKMESPALVLDAGLTAEQAQRVREYALPIFVHELTDAQVAELNAQQMTKRLMDQRNEPKTLRDAIDDIKIALADIAQLNQAITLHREKAKGKDGVAVEEIRKNKENVTTLAARKLRILGKVYLGRQEEELKLIAEKECLELAARFTVLAQARLDQMAAGPVVAQAAVEETPESKFKKMKKKLVATESNIRSAQGAIKRGAADIVRLQAEIATVKEQLRTAAALDDDGATEGALEQHDALVAALESAEKKLNGDPKSGKPSLAKKLASFESAREKQRAEIAQLREQLPPDFIEAPIAPTQASSIVPAAAPSPGPTVVTQALAPTISGVLPPPPAPLAPPAPPAAISRPNPMGGAGALFAAINARRKDDK